MIFRKIYVGDDTDVIVRYNAVFGGQLEIFSDCAEALGKIGKGNKEDYLILFYQKSKSELDTPRLKDIKSRCHRIYILLISGPLTDAERKEYLESGVNDTVPPDVDCERLAKGIEFIEANKEIISSQKIVPEGAKKAKAFRLPLWKRMFDILFSLAALLFLSPVFILVALAIWLEDRGTITYKAKRVGSNYHVFDFYKFRSMYMDADKRLREFKALDQYGNEEKKLAGRTGAKEQPVPVLFGDDSPVPDFLDRGGANMLVSDDCLISEQEFNRRRSREQEKAFVKLDHDPRVTRVGKFIRKYSIDELPQLFNILKGDMSLVGNRPLPLYEAELLTSDDYVDRFFAPSGLTGLWQVEKRGGAGKMSPEERKQLDIKYAKTFSFWLDVKIILKTFTAFIQKESV